MKGNHLPKKIDWDQVRFLELDTTSVQMVLSDGAKVSLDYSSSEDLQDILQQIGKNQKTEDAAQ